MSNQLLITLAVLLVIGLIVWSAVAQRRRRRVHEQAVERLGLSPCPEKKGWLENIVIGIENNHGYRYEVRDAKWSPGPPPVYYYVKRRDREDRGSEDRTFAEDELLFSLKRPSAGGLVLVVKPSTLPSGLATRMLGAVAGARWDAQPDDLQRLDLPVDLKETNLLAALGPAGASFYDLVDTRTLGVVLGLGDLGAMYVRFRGEWCAIAGVGVGSQVPFRPDEIIARMRALA